MTIEQDARLQKLFDAARQDMAADVFVADITSKVDGLRRRAIIRWALLGLALTVIVVLLAPPLTQAIHLLVQVLPQSLIEFDDSNGLLSEMLAPINSIALPVAVGVLGLWVAYRKIF